MPRQPASPPPTNLLAIAHVATLGLLALDLRGGRIEHLRRGRSWSRCDSCRRLVRRTVLSAISLCAARIFEQQVPGPAGFSQADIDLIAHEMNGRPRKFGWSTSAQTLNHMLDKSQSTAPTESDVEDSPGGVTSTP
jgi:hypothetical protein